MFVQHAGKNLVAVPFLGRSHGITAHAEFADPKRLSPSFGILRVMRMSKSLPPSGFRSWLHYTVEKVRVGDLVLDQSLSELEAKLAEEEACVARTCEKNHVSPELVYWLIASVGQEKAESAVTAANAAGAAQALSIIEDAAKRRIQPSEMAAFYGLDAQ